MTIEKIDPSFLSEHAVRDYGNYYVAPEIIRAVYLMQYGERYVMAARSSLAATGWMYFNPESPACWNSARGQVFTTKDDVSYAFAEWYNAVSLYYHPYYANSERT